MKPYSRANSATIRIRPVFFIIFESVGEIKNKVDHKSLLAKVNHYLPRIQNHTPNPLVEYVAHITQHDEKKDTSRVKLRIEQISTLSLAVEVLIVAQTAYCFFIRISSFSLLSSSGSSTIFSQPFHLVNDIRRVQKGTIAK